MKWAYTIKNKMMASASLLTLCLLVLFSNYIDRNHTKNVKEAISTLYEDRLIAEDYILKMTSRLYQIKELIHTDTINTNQISKIDNLLLAIKAISNAYHETKFTELEDVKAVELLSILDKMEATPIANSEQTLVLANKALVLLNELSAIQLEESKQIMKSAERLYTSGKASSQLVFAIIIVILLVLQALVFTSKPIVVKQLPNSPNLN